MGMHMGHTLCDSTWAVGIGQWALGSGYWAVGSGHWAVGSGQWAVKNFEWFRKNRSTHSDSSPLTFRRPLLTLPSPLSTDQQLYCHQHARASAAQKASKHTQCAAAASIVCCCRCCCLFFWRGRMGTGQWALGAWPRADHWGARPVFADSVRCVHATAGPPPDLRVSCRSCTQGTGRLLSGCLSACTVTALTLTRPDAVSLRSP